jgi:steroid 5-alpha reductase family enzyme
VATSLEALYWLVGLMTGIWIISLIRRDASTVDPVWGLAFLVASWVYWASADAMGARQVLVLALVHAWALRLTLYLLRRNWGQPEDRRYRAMRERAGARFAWTSLFVVFWLQAALAWVISFPLHAALVSPRPDDLTGLDWLGVGLFLVGFAFEAVGDWQLSRFKAQPGNAGAVCDRGLWRYTRHPNYFGEAVLWWGLSCFALGTPGAAWTLVAPVLMTVLLLRVSGVSLLEHDLRQTKPGYAMYVSRTSAFVPWFPKQSNHGSA